MTSLYLLILIYLAFPMIVYYDKNKRVRFLVCGVIYYFIDVIKAYLDKEPLEKWTNVNVKNKLKREP